MNRNPKNSMMLGRPNGFSMIEVLVTIVILSIGLLGMAGLQVRALTVQMEAYQREQALVLVQDIADRIDANRKNAADYIAEIDPAACPTDVTTRAQLDLVAWCDALKGVSEKEGSANVGSIIGAYGCITQISAGSVPTATASGTAAEYLVAVAWQGLHSTSSQGVTCGAGAGRYGSDDSLRRVISLPVRIANLK